MAAGQYLAWLNKSQGGALDDDWKAGVAMRLHGAAIHLLRTARVADRETDMTPARLSVLSVLVFGGPRTLTQLTQAEQVAAPTMTKLVAGLERDGYVRRRMDQADARSWIIQATPRATRALHRARDRRVALMLELLSDLRKDAWQNLELAADTLERALAQRRA